MAALLLYILTLAPTVLEADSGEFQFVPWLPGIAHPPGYPLYTLLGWLWTHLFPFGEVAWRMNLLSAIVAALTVGLTYAVVRQMLAKTLPSLPDLHRLLAAFISGAMFAVTHTFWSQAIIAEVYALHAFFIALILWLALKVQTMGCDWRAWPAKLLTFVFGLSLTHHLTTILLLPALLAFLFISEKRVPQTQLEKSSKVKLLFIHGTLFCAPLLLYLYLPLAAPTTPYTTLSLSDNQTLTLYDNSLSGFWHHITAIVFTSEIRPAAVGFDRVQFAWRLLWLQVGGIGIGFALVGLITLWQRRQFDLLLLTGLGSLIFLSFNLIYFIGDVYVLFIPVWLFVCLWIGLGSVGLAHWLVNSFVRRKTRMPKETLLASTIERRLSKTIYELLVVSLLCLCCLLLVLPTLIHNIQVSQKTNDAARQRWREILAESVPKEAILLSNDRNEIMPMWYYQYVEGLRPDLFGLFPLIVTDPKYANIGRVLDQALASGRPVYLIKPMDGLELKADLVQEGTLYRATVNEYPPPYRHEVIFPKVTIPPGIDSIKLLGYDLSAEQVSPGGQITVTLYWQAVKELSTDYTSYVHLIKSDDQGLTQSDHRPGGNFYPSRYWQPGEILRDHHTLTIPPGAPAGPYRLRVGMYYQPEPGLILEMGHGEEIGQVIVPSEFSE
ncbi:MAG: DUF2723 domain-containing protein [Anaerolineae bacterium]|nr:DUF2723 domain-containing protein [Anaerolineae bacterium]